MAVITYNNYLRQLLSELEKDGDEQVITESLANYEEHGESFDGLRISEHLRGRFKKYSNWAKEYYEEWVPVFQIFVSLKK